MVPGDGSYEKLEHQLLFLRERGLTSPDIEQCNRRLWLSTQLAGGDSSKLDSRFVDRIHVEMGEATVRQMKASGVFEEWLDSWDAHNGIETQPPEELSVADVNAEPVVVIETNPAQELRELAEELRQSMRALRGESEVGILEAAERHEPRFSAALVPEPDAAG